MQALFNNTGSSNTAQGVNALLANTSGSNNTAAGVASLQKNNTGADNSAFGIDPLFANTSGNNNTALGFAAGQNLTTGSNNIDIGNVGTAADANTIRIGNSGQTATYIAGISGASVSGAAVVVASNGQLGVSPSAARFKREIRAMGGASDSLMKLRPVTFIYRNDASNTHQLRAGGGGGARDS